MQQRKLVQLRPYQVYRLERPRAHRGLIEQLRQLVAGRRKT
jgi:hypothetical protein